MKDQVIPSKVALAGIGRALVSAAAGEGSGIVASGRSYQTGEVLETEHRALGAEARFIDVNGGGTAR